MKEVNWQMKENFAFPSEIGQPESAENIRITPRFTVEEFEGRPKVTGIYHIALDVQLTDAQHEVLQFEDAILIDDLEINEGTGYFEYALPFNIDFPPEAETPVDFKVENPSYEIEGVHLAMIWDVKCAYTEAGIGKIQEQPQEKTETASNDAKAVGNSEVFESKSEQTVEATTEKNAEQESEATSKQAVAKAPVETTVFADNGDEVLDFIAELEDGVSTTSFRLNDIFV